LYNLHLEIASIKSLLILGHDNYANIKNGSKFVSALILFANP